MQDGERVRVRGSSGTTYELSRSGDVYACTCPSWRNQGAPPSQRSCKHLRAHLGEAHEASRLAALASRPRARRSGETLAVHARREAALATALARFPAVAERMRAVYGMPLPRHIAYSAALWLGLTDEEREDAWSYLGCGPAGILEWFEDDGLARVPALDERLHFRYRRDPPEFVTVWSGNSDGGHWGLWYDDPRELPRLVAFNYARDDAVTGPCRPTLLATLRHEMARERWPAHEYPHAARVLAWLVELHGLELAAHREEAIAPPTPRADWCIAGMDPIVPGASLPDDLAGRAAHDLRYRTFRDEPERAGEWLAQARRELAEGRPLRALFYGRELHWIDCDALRDACTELLTAAYRALGRDALAEVVRVHHEHRDLPSVGIYGPPPEPPLPPLVAAAAANDTETLARLLAAGPPDAATLATALARTSSLPALELLLPHATPVQLDAKTHDLLGELALLLRELPDAAAACEQVVDLLLARGASHERAFTRALAAGCPALALRLLASIDARGADAHGVTPLHRAAQAGAVDVVAALLARGADPQARDASGSTAIDRARDLWQDRRAECHAILALLRERVPAAEARSQAGPLAPGDLVVHEKFGEGRVHACEGAGERTKLTIRFADATRTLLARFVRRVG